MGGFQFAESLGIDLSTWEDVGALDKIFYQDGVYVTPYFDYQQFPNDLIACLVRHIVKNQSLNLRPVFPKNV